MATAKANTKDIVSISPIIRKQMTLRIVGDTPLIVHCWDAKAKRQILETELGYKVKRSKDEEAKNPAADFASSMYWLTPMPNELTEENVNEAIANGAKFGFPLTGIKQAAISAAYRMGWSKDKMSLRGAFYIEQDFPGYYAGELMNNKEMKRVDIVPNHFHLEPMIEIHADSVVMREDMVKVGMGSADIRYRGQLNDWYADLKIVYNANGNKSPDEIASIIEAGGYVCGIGEWRPERDGQYGMFHVARSAD